MNQKDFIAYISNMKSKMLLVNLWHSHILDELMLVIREKVENLIISVKLRIKR